MKSKKRIKAHSKEISNRYEYGKGMNFKCVQQELKIDEKRENMPLEGDILYYKKRSGSGKINKWRFIKEETQGVNKGKWKVQGLHLADGAYNWFYPSSLKSLEDMTKQEELIRETKIAFNDKVDGIHHPPSNRELIRKMSEKNKSQREIADELEISPSAVSQHLKKINEESLLEKKEEDVPVFSMKETAEYFQIGKNQLNQIIADNNIKPYQIRNRKEFTESQIDKIQKIIEKTKKPIAPEGWMTLSGAREYLKIGWQTIYNAMNDLRMEPIAKNIRGKRYKLIKNDEVDRLKDHFASKGFYKDSTAKKAIEKIIDKKNPPVTKPDSALEEYIIRGNNHEKEDIETYPISYVTRMLHIGMPKLISLMEKNNLVPRRVGNKKILTSSQIKLMADDLKNEMSTEEEVESLHEPKVHQATKDLKIKNYKMIIGENLKMINSLVHQTKELLEKM
tara:strand:- start:1880 stop:3229 length:1350 start_codon:yes stop_codon:yes gene_type:complete